MIQIFKPHLQCFFYYFELFWWLPFWMSSMASSSFKVKLQKCCQPIVLAKTNYPSLWIAMEIRFNILATKRSHFLKVRKIVRTFYTEISLQFFYYWNSVLKFDYQNLLLKIDYYNLLFIFSIKILMIRWNLPIRISRL